MRQLPVDCLNDIFEFLEGDKNTLCSCLLVNRLWCEISVRILWRNALYAELPIGIFRTLLACLSDKSKELLHKNGIAISTPTLKSPLFNYVSFCNVLSIGAINNAIDYFLTSSNSNIPANSSLLKQEILKMLMKHITTLKRLSYYLGLWSENFLIESLTFTHFPGAKDCLMKLSGLNCDSKVPPVFFSQLSKICHNIKSLSITFINHPSNELVEFISSQNNLKYLSLSKSLLTFTRLVIPLTIHSNTITKLSLRYFEPISFMVNFTRLEELSLTFDNTVDLGVLQYAIFPNLRILRFYHEHPKDEILIKFLENNGKNLKSLFLPGCDDSMNLLICELCPNLE